MNIVLIGGNKGLGKAVKDMAKQKGHSVTTVGRTDCDIKLDLSWPSKEIKAALKPLRTGFSPIDSVIITSGMGAYHGALVSDETVHKLFQTNVFGPMAVYRALLGRLIQDKGKCIVVTSTAARKPGSGGLSLYAATKGAINSWVISEGRRAIKHDVGLCAVAPGFFSSPMTEAMEPGLIKAVTSAIPAKRFGYDYEVANFVLNINNSFNWSIAGNIFECSGGA